MRSFLRLTSAFFVISLFLIVSAVPASAHAVVESTNPYNGQELASSPEKISITFNEKVEASFGSFRLFDEEGKRIIPRGEIVTNGKTISQQIPQLKRGTYFVAYSVVSSDTHPVRGGFIFSVDSPINRDVASSKNFEDAVNAQQSRAVSIGVDVVRFIIFLCVALVIALLFFYYSISRDLPQALSNAIYVALAICGVVSLISLSVYAAYSRNVGLFDAVNGHDLTQEASSRSGIVALARVVLCLGAIFLWKYREKVPRFLGLMCCVIFALTLAVAGHATVGSYAPIALIVDIVHVLAASIWLGGLVALVFFLSRGDGIVVAQKFSRVALWCVIAIAATGAFAWWRQISSIAASTSTWFGQLVSFKSILFCCALVVAFFTRRFVRTQSEASGNSVDVRTRVRRCIIAEIVLLVVVMAATSVLVGTVPGKTALRSPVSRHISVSTGYIDVTIDPAEVGPTDIHLFMLTEEGTPYQVSDLGASLTNDIATVTLSQKTKNVSLPVTMKFQGLNHFVSTGANFPFQGTWTLTIRVRTGEFDEIVATTNILVRP